MAKSSGSIVLKSKIPIKASKAEAKFSLNKNTKKRNPHHAVSTSPSCPDKPCLPQVANKEQRMKMLAILQYFESLQENFKAAQYRGSLSHTIQAYRKDLVQQYGQKVLESQVNMTLQFMTRKHNKRNNIVSKEVVSKDVGSTEDEGESSSSDLSPSSTDDSSSKSESSNTDDGAKETKSSFRLTGPTCIQRGKFPVDMSTSKVLRDEDAKTPKSNSKLKNKGKKQKEPSSESDSSSDVDKDKKVQKTSVKVAKKVNGMTKPKEQSTSSSSESDSSSDVDKDKKVQKTSVKVAKKANGVTKPKEQSTSSSSESDSSSDVDKDKKVQKTSIKVAKKVNGVTNPKEHSTNSRSESDDSVGSSFFAEPMESRARKKDVRAVTKAKESRKKEEDNLGHNLDVRSSSRLGRTVANSSTVSNFKNSSNACSDLLQFGSKRKLDGNKKCKSNVGCNTLFKTKSSTHYDHEGNTDVSDTDVSEVDTSDVSSTDDDDSSLPSTADDDDSKSSASLSNDENSIILKQLKKKQEQDKIAAAAAAALAWTPKTPTNDHVVKVNVLKGSDGAQALSSGKPFRRVDDNHWGIVAQEDGGAMADNSYEGIFGNEGFGAKANANLLRVRGKRFQHEKTKAKRSYNGFAKTGHGISMESFSTKFAID